jgi:hypothetical protein
MMEWHGFKPEGPLSADARDSEKTVRVLFLFRNLIVHNGGRFDLSGPRRTPAEKKSYRWFITRYPAAKVREGSMLRLPADEVITPLVDGCVAYSSE